MFCAKFTNTQPLRQLFNTTRHLIGVLLFTFTIQKPYNIYMIKSRYLPYDPKKGDLVFHRPEANSWVSALKNPDLIETQAGIIKTVLGPEHSGPMIDYDIDVLMLDGSSKRSKSQEWGCFRELVTMAQKHVETQHAVLDRLEKLRSISAENGLKDSVEEDIGIDL